MELNKIIEAVIEELEDKEKEIKENFIPKKVIEDKIRELHKKNQEDISDTKFIQNAYAIIILQELLEENK